MRSLLALLRGAIQVGLTYRLGFFFSLIGNAVYLVIAYFLWRSIFAGAGTLRGMTFEETFLYVALGSSVFILLKSFVDWQMSFDIREGFIAVYLTKPMDYQVYNLTGALGYSLLNAAVITVPTLLLITLAFDVPIPAGLGLFLFPVSLGFAFLISFCFDYAVGLLAFYTESIWGLSITKEVILTALSGALIPLPFFPEAIQKVLMVLPFQAVYHTPLTMITRPDQGWDVFLPMLAVQALWTAALVLLSRLFYNHAIKILRISGG